MKFSLNTKRLQKKVSDYFDRDREKKLEPAPYRDWMILMVALMVFGLGFASVGYYLFIQINRGELFVIEAPDREALRAIDRGELRDTIAQYEKKKAGHSTLLENRPRVVSPD